MRLQPQTSTPIISERPGDFNAPITLTKFEQTRGKEQGVVLEVIQDQIPTTSNVFQITGDHRTENYFRWYLGERGNNYPAYRLHFKQLPATAGEYPISFRTTDSLGVVKEHNYILKTVERSQTLNDLNNTRADFWITNADARYKIGDKYSIDAETVVPQSTEAQTIATV